MLILNRRVFLSSLSALALGACAGNAQTQRPVARTANDIPSDLQPIPNAAFSAWVDRFRPRALGKGISAGTFDAAFANAGYLPGVVKRDRNQIQNTRTLEDYLSIAASEERIALGKAAYRQHASVLNALEARYGVEAKIIAAIWGAESQYGEKRGFIPVISSTATLAFDGRRGDFYESQLVAALKILERGDTTPAQLVGSWAGAMGHTQFIPTSFEGFAVDFTGDGKRDIWSDDPTDSLASTAAYLSRNGWRTGLPWGAEAGPNAPAGRALQPQAGGVSFSVTRNFNVIKTYNNSDFYAIGIGHLADRIAGAGPLRGGFPPDENGLSKVDRMALQRGLTSQGYDLGTIDGVIGAKTEAAISDYQASRGLAVTGTPSLELVARLK